MKSFFPVTLFLLAACTESSPSPITPLASSAASATSADAVHVDAVLPSAPSLDALSATRPTASAINAFNADLYAALKSQKGNLIYSPASIEAALAMTSVGARGTTASEMSKVLHLPVDSNATATSFSALLSSWAQKDAGGAELAVADRLWLQKDYALVPEFTATTRDKFFAPTELIDFNNPTASAKTINSWVATSTHGKISDLISAHDINSATRLILTNAVYFKGKWAEPFEKGATTNGPFTTSTHEAANVPLMNHSFHSADYADAGNAQVIDLPYEGTSARALSMTIVLPKSGTDLSAIESTFTAKDLDQWTARESGQRVEVTLPKFTAKQTMSLSQTLEGMGMQRAFTNAADFSGISTHPEGLFIGDVLHKAFIDVDEAGTEAAAATGVTAVAGAVMVQETKPIVFRADHPFLFFLRDKTTRTILFAGRVSDPR